MSDKLNKPNKSTRKYNLSKDEPETRDLIIYYDPESKSKKTIYRKQLLNCNMTYVEILITT